MNMTLFDVSAIAGFVLLSVGLWMLSPAAALCIGGGILFVGGLVGHLRGGAQ